MIKRIIILITVIFIAITLTACKEQRAIETTTNKPSGVDANIAKTDTNIAVEKEPELPKDPEQYNWSTMSGGPYKDSISYATSTDLLNWTDSQVVLANHTSVPGAIVKDGVIYVYFVDVSQDGLPEQTGLIKSTDDGQTWSDKILVSYQGLGNKVPVDPAPFLLADGHIRLYYFDISQRGEMENPLETNKIYSAISTDGVNFEPEEGIRYSEQNIFDPDVEKVSETWYLYVGDLTNNQVLVATATDGLNFTKQGVAYQGGAVPDVFYQDGTYYLYVAGIDIATSTDGLSFARVPQRFQSQQSFLTADPSVIKLSAGSYMMFYKIKFGATK